MSGGSAALSRAHRSEHGRRTTIRCHAARRYRRLQSRREVQWRQLPSAFSRRMRASSRIVQGAVSTIYDSMSSFFRGMGVWDYERRGVRVAGGLLSRGQQSSAGRGVKPVRWIGVRRTIVDSVANRFVAVSASCAGVVVNGRAIDTFEVRRQRVSHWSRR